MDDSRYSTNGRGNTDILEKGYGTFNQSPKAVLPRLRREQSIYASAIKGWSWMSLIDDETPLSALTIPGTHDSAAYTYSWPFIATQTMSIAEQLDAGIRYFDLRCGLRDDIVEMVHGTAVLGVRLDVLLEAMYAWLEKHPTEAIIAQIKRDRQEEKSKMEFAQAIVKTIGARSERWRTANTTPSMGELRGRIQLFRRFTGSSLYAYGLDVTRWQDNPSRPFTIYTWHGVRVTIQDHYTFPNPETLPALIQKKGGDVSELLEAAANDPFPDHWYINFTSAFEINFFHQITPRQVALGGYAAFKWEEGMNLRFKGYLDSQVEKGKRRYGIVAMDFPEAGAEDLVLSVIETNFMSREPRLTLKSSLLLLLWLVGVVTLGLWTWSYMHELRCGLDFDDFGSLSTPGHASATGR